MPSVLLLFLRNMDRSPSCLELAVILVHNSSPMLYHSNILPHLYHCSNLLYLSHYHHMLLEIQHLQNKNIHHQSYKVYLDNDFHLFHGNCSFLQFFNWILHLFAWMLPCIFWRIVFPQLKNLFDWLSSDMRRIILSHKHLSSVKEKMSLSQRGKKSLSTLTSLLTEISLWQLQVLQITNHSCWHWKFWVKSFLSSSQNNNIYQDDLVQNIFHHQSKMACHFVLKCSSCRIVMQSCHGLQKTGKIWHHPKNWSINVIIHRNIRHILKSPFWPLYFFF